MSDDVLTCVADQRTLRWGGLLLLKGMFTAVLLKGMFTAGIVLTCTCHNTCFVFHDLSLANHSQNGLRDDLGSHSDPNSAPRGNWSNVVHVWDLPTRCST